MLFLLWRQNVFCEGLQRKGTNLLKYSVKILRFSCFWRIETLFFFVSLRIFILERELSCSRLILPFHILYIVFYHCCLSAVHQPKETSDVLSWHFRHPVWFCHMCLRWNVLFEFTFVHTCIQITDLIFVCFHMFMSLSERILWNKWHIKWCSWWKSYIIDTAIESIWALRVMKTKIKWLEKLR